MANQEQPDRNGCYDRQPFKTTLNVQDGWLENGAQRIKEIPFRNSMDCQYSKSTADKRCEGCKWNQQK